MVSLDLRLGKIGRVGESAFVVSPVAASSVTSV